MARLSSFVPLALALALAFCLFFGEAEAQAKKTIVEDQEVVPVEIRKTLATLNITTLYVDELPSPAVVEPGEVKPLDKAHILHVNRDAFRSIDIEVGDDDLLADQLDDIISYLSGKKPLPGTNPHSMRWAGTQLNLVFPDLGDSRSYVLGQVTNSKGEVFDLYLKGSGPTKATAPSDRGKGRIPLQFALRDYVLSEAAYRLGVPVARSLALIGSEDPIGEEDMARTTSTMILKLAPTNIRFGIFQNLHLEHKNEHIKTLADYSIKHHFPSLLSIPTERAVWMTDDDDDEDEFVCVSSRDDCPKYRYAEWLKHVLVRQVSLLSAFKTFGLHMGLISTENINILGVLNDLDRASFVEVYTENSPLYCDRQNLYAFNKQSNIIGMHIMSFTRWIKEALGLTTNEIEDALEEVKTMIALTRNSYVVDKYGIVTASPHLNRFTEKVLNEVSLDFTEFHKFLSGVDMHATDLEGQCPFDMVLLAQSNKQYHTRERYQGVSKYLEAFREARWALTEEQRAERDLRMREVNPRFIPRHFMIEWTATMIAANHSLTRCLDVLMERVTRPLEDHTPEDLANFAACGFNEGPKFRSREYFLHCHPAAGFSSESPEFVDNGLDKKSFFGAKGFITNFDDPVVYTPIK